MENITSPLEQKKSKRPWLAKLGAALALLGACVGAYWLGHNRHLRALANSGLVIEESYLNVGQTWANNKFLWTLPVRNTTATDIDVLGFASSCACLAINPQSFRLPPGQTQNLVVTIDLGRVRSPAKGEGELKVAIIPHIKGATIPQEGWLLQGTVRDLLTPSRPVVHFGDLVRNTSWPERLFRARARIPLDSILAKTDSALAHVEPLGKEGDEYVFRFTLDQTLPVGPFGLKAFLYPKSSGMALPATAVHLQGCLHEEVEASPSVIPLGYLPLRTVVHETIFLASRTGLPFTIQSWKAPSNDIWVEPVPKGGKWLTKAIKVSQRISAIGTRNSSLVFVVGLSDSRTIEVPFAASYHGVPATGGTETASSCRLRP
jgi:hypothetical protein